MHKKSAQALEQEITELRQRIDHLEALLAAKPVPPLAPPPQTEIAPEIVLAISAAVAAFLGKRATIRQIRLSDSSAWASQGRATIQASHAIVRGLR
jgi:methylmalonyl-CoA carboxyltransferase large subunit